MLKGLLKLSWIETKIFLREPMGVVGSLAMPVILFLLLGKALRMSPRLASRPVSQLPVNITIVAAILIALGAVQSLVAIMAIYREGGILKRLRATPLSPVTILGAHVLVKLGFTAVSLVLLDFAGKRILPGALPHNMVAFSGAVMLGTLSILSLGFLLASVVRTARFAQPFSAAVMYPMLAISGLFIPLAVLPPVLRAIAYLLPTTHAVALMQGVWDGAGWAAQAGSIAALLALFAIFIALSARWFRWE
jgi:ABC-2 type transport system permease protein